MGAEQRQPLGKMEALAGLGISLQSPSHPEMQQSRVLCSTSFRKRSLLCHRAPPANCNLSSQYLVQ